MSEEKCVFCAIISGKLPSYKIYEDGEHVAFLDLYPIARGQALVVPKAHMNSKFYEAEDKELAGLMLVAKKVSKAIIKKLPAKRVSLVLEGLDVNHLHVKLYPDRGIAHLGPKATDEELEEIRKKIAE
jgi:histidine triad (HIT) family protein